MKKWHIIFAFMLLLPFRLQAQLNKVCVIQLRNGNKIKGRITNIIPKESVTIVTPQNHQFVIYTENISKLKKLDGGMVSWDLSRIAIQLNPVGLAQLGPGLQLDVGIKANTFIGMHGRLSKVGSWYEDATDRLPYRMPPSDIAAGISITHFFDRIASPNKYYLSLIAEYSQGKSTGFDINSRKWSGENYEINILAGIGHRWRFRRGLFINLGLAGGISKSIEDNWWYNLEPEKIFDGKNKIYFPGMFLFAFGWEINKR